MDIVIIGIIVFLVILLLLSTVDDHVPHHDSRKGSFYEISNRKD